MASSSAIGSGGVGIQPWSVSHREGPTSAGPGEPAPLASGTAQSGSAGGSTGMGGLFAEWPGKTFINWPGKGLFGGLGDRGTVR